ncbi:MAG: hypothetical protein WBC51_18345 [Vicinamibacterales bacterium]
MRTTARIMLGLFGSLTICVDAAGQSMTRPGTQIIPQGPLTPKSAALQQATFNVICRGGPTLRVDPAGNGRSMVYFLPGRKLPGALGAGLEPGECSPLDRLFAAEEPPGIQFADKGGEESIATHRADSNRYWQFAVVKATGYFDARSYQRTLAVESAPASGIATKLATASDAVAKKPGDEPQGKPEIQLQGGATARNPSDKVALNPQPLPPRPQPTDVIHQPAGNVPNPAGRSAPGVEELQQATFGILCRGGGTLRVDALQGGRHGVYFQKSERVPDRYGATLKPGECSPVDRPFAAEDPPGIQFSNMAGEESVQEHKAASDHYWRFDVVKTNYGYFDARRYERVLQPQAAADPATVSELAVGRISDVRVTPRDRSVRLDFIAAPDATPSVLIVRGPAKVDPNGVVLSWVGAPMVLSAQREANASSATVTRYIADSLSDRRHDPSHLSMLDPGAQYHYVISDNNDTSRRVGGVFTTLHAGASGAPAPAVASGTPPPASKQDDRGIIIVGGREAVGERATAARVTQEDINRGVPGPPPEHAVVRPAEKIDPDLHQLAAPATANLSELGDRAIIIVGGKKMTAGEAKRQIQGELRQATGNARTVSVSRNAAQIVRNANTPLIDAPGRLAQPGQPIAGAAAGASRAAALAMDCATNPPRISNIQGAITSSGRFTVNGTCFGLQAGSIEIIGQFPGGNLRPAFAQWTESAILVETPALPNIPGHTVAVSVRRAGDGKQSVAKQAQFVAALHVVEVPSELWNPSGNFSKFDVARASGDAINGYTSFGPRAEQRKTSFQLRVNPACVLEALDVPATVGQVSAVNGWERGAPYEANVEIVWTPSCRIYSMDYLVATTQERHCWGAFELKARAACPTGVSVR